MSRKRGAMEGTNFHIFEEEEFFFGKGRKRHSALTIRNYQKMYICDKGDECVCMCVPFIISM